MYICILYSVVYDFIINPELDLLPFVADLLYSLLL